jgi:preprotein translocase subunit SecA
MLNKSGIEHKVLNAKFHEKEAEIVAQAGMPGAVTIATNMAGRGTDIVLGGNFEVEISQLNNPSEQDIAACKEAWKLRNAQVLKAGGLHILGTERHESRRIDNQLRGRAGRQGDPGVTRFYLSLEDDLMRIFASERVRNMMRALGMNNGEAIEHRMVNNAIEKAQRKVEGRNFDIRKSLLEFDDVANDQRQVIYKQRDDILKSESLSAIIDKIRVDVVEETISSYIPPQSVEEMWDVAGLELALQADFSINAPVRQWLDDDAKLNETGLRTKILNLVAESYKNKASMIGVDMQRFEKHIFLQVLDGLWKEHLATMDHLRMGIHLRGYAGKNPKQEYKRESFELFEAMLTTIKFDVIQFLSKVKIQTEEEINAIEEQRRIEAEAESARATASHAAPVSMSTGGAEQQAVKAEPETKVETFVRDGRKVGRNEACPCGSGKKYKQCHGKLD